ncbi:MAG TPA: ribonuclease P protein component [Candidatus Omnitrophota bacterium]|nr:ribonuclease P protein component [Candidatus Omnitrophota bacterium]
MKIVHLKKKKDFSDILAKGIVIRGRIIKAYTAFRDDSQVLIGVTITKRAVPKATKRNYIKRVIYGKFAREKKVFKPGVTLLFRMTRALPDTVKTNKTTAEAISHDVETILNKIPDEKTYDRMHTRI